jgi:hypothetical protein
MFDSEYCSPATATVVEAVGALCDGELPEADMTLGADAKVLLGLRRRYDARLAALLVAAAGRDLPDLEGARNVAAWAAQELCMAPGEATVLYKAGRAALTHPATGKAFNAGTISARHVNVIADGLRSLPPGAVRHGDEKFAEDALHNTPKELRALIDRYRATVDPEADDKETRDLKDEQYFHASPTLGGVKVDGWLTGSNAEWFTQGLDRFSKPVPDDLRTATQRRADGAALMARVAAGADIAARDLADTGYTPNDLPTTRVTVITDVITLQRALDAAAERAMIPSWLPAAEQEMVQGARGERTGTAVDWRALLANVCDGDVQRLVLSGKSEVLDLGRESRFYSRAQRRALARGGRMVCAWPHCDSPWVEAHHQVHWAHGGGTDLATGILLCSYHHTLFHAGWRLDESADGPPKPNPPLDWYYQRTRKRRSQPRAA